jgi:YegS/Rv2252/BmrU family lipid kinase
MSTDATSNAAATGLGPGTRAWLVANPTAGGGRRGEALRTALGVLVQAGWEVAWRPTEAPLHAESLAREASLAGMDLVVAAGGDGTVHEVANGLAGSRTALAVLPAGTGNVLAGQLGLVGVPTPLNRVDLPAAARSLVKGRIRPVDLGFARPHRGPGRYFLMWAGIGLDAEITEAMEGEARDLKRNLGPAAFGIVGAQRLLAARGQSSLIRCDRAALRGDLLLGLVSNVRLYAGAVEVAPEARLDDGLLDLSLFFTDGPLTSLRHLGDVLTGNQRADATRIDAQASRLRFISREPLAVHLDAEPFGTTPLTVEIRALALRLLVPEGAPEALFVAALPSPD